MTTSARPCARWLTVDDVAVITGKPRSVIERQLIDGTFPGRYERHRRRWRIDPAAVDEAVLDLIDSLSRRLREEG